MAKIEYLHSGDFYGTVSASEGVFDGVNRVYSVNNNPPLSALGGQITITQISATGTPSTTTYLRGDGSWSTVSGGTGATSTSGLSDVSAVAPLNGQTLVYSSATSKYIPSKGTSIDFGEFTEVLMPGINWTSANSTSANTQMYKIAFGNGLFVATDYNTSANTFLTSPDGINWTGRPTGFNQTFFHLTFGNGIFVATSTTFTITSFDGIVWTSRTHPVTNINCHCYGNGQFVGLAYNTSSVAKSDNGIDWSVSTLLPESAQWQAICYGNGLYVAVGYAGVGNRLVRSVDGVNWTTHTNPLSSQKFRSIAYGNGTFVAVTEDGATNRVMTSPDGITWTARTIPLQSWMCVSYGGGLFVAVANTGTKNRIATSPDGITWTSRVTPIDNLWTYCCYGDGMFVVCSSDGTSNRFMYSGRRKNTENDSFEYINSPQTFKNSLTVNGISTFTSGINVPNSTNGQVLVYSSATSKYVPRTDGFDYRYKSIQDTIEDFPHVPSGLVTDDIGKTWTKIEMGATIGAIASLCYLGNGIVLAGSGIWVGIGDVYRSTDYGLTWIKIEMGAALETVRALCYLGNGIVLAGAGDTTGDGDAYRSTDYGLTWVLVEMGATLEAIYSLCYLGNGIVLAGTGFTAGDGDVYRSTDYGLTWVLVEMGATLEGVYALCYLGNGIVLAGAGDTTGDGDAYRSTDYGLTWVKIEMGATLEAIYSLCYLGNGIVLAGAGATGGDGDVYRSTDYGLTWTVIEMGAGLERLATFSYIGNGIVLVGAGNSTGDGDIYKSTDYGLTWVKIEMGAGLEAMYSLCYLGNGIVLAGTGFNVGVGDIYRSVTSWNTENNYIRVIDNSVNFQEAGKINMAASTTAAACFNMPQGVNPTGGYVEGDIWRPANDYQLFFRRASTNYSFVFLEAGNSFTAACSFASTLRLDSTVTYSALTSTVPSIATLTSAGIIGRAPVYASNITTMTPTGTTASWDCSLYDTGLLNLGSATGTVTLTLTSLQVGSKYQLKTVQHASAAKSLTITASGYTIKTPAGGGYAISTGLGAIDLLSMSVISVNELLVVTSKGFS